MNRRERGDEAKLKLTVGVLFAVPSANRRKRDMTEALGVASQELSRDDLKGFRLKPATCMVESPVDATSGLSDRLPLDLVAQSPQRLSSKGHA